MRNFLRTKTPLQQQGQLQQMSRQRNMDGPAADPIEEHSSPSW